MSLIKPKAPRWYREENGVVEACYQLPKKDGSGLKDTTLREARELGLLPSVTSILRVMAQPGLERYKLEQVIYSAITLHREMERFYDWANRVFPSDVHFQQSTAHAHARIAYDNLPAYTESEDAYAQRIVEDSEAQGARAAEFGTRIHDAIADLFNKRGLEPASFIDPEILPYLNSFREWKAENIEEIHAVEKVVGGKRCGYAGRLDLDCTLKGVGRTICDFKTQGIKEYKSPVFYGDSWLPQLCAYRDAATDCIPRIMSLVINSRAPGPVWPKLWELEEMVKGTKIFVYCRELWKALNDYDPTQPVFDPTAGVKQAREDYADKQMGLNPRSI